MANLTISQLARVAGVNLETIRFYEAQRLLPKPPRSPAGYRQYGPDAADRIRFIKRAQELGFSLNEIRELLELRTGPSASQAEIRGRALAKSGKSNRRSVILKRSRRILKSSQGHVPDMARCNNVQSSKIWT